MTLSLHPRVAPEVEAIRHEFSSPVGDVAVREENGEQLLVIPYSADGWSPDPLFVVIKVPPMYPEQRPDLIFIRSDARRSSGTEPCQKMTSVHMLGHDWTQVSWHFTEPYDPARDNLHRFAQSVRSRYLRECR